MKERIARIETERGRRLAAAMNGHPSADLEGVDISGQALRFIDMIRRNPEDFDEPDSTIEQMLQAVETRLGINHA